MEIGLRLRSTDAEKLIYLATKLTGRQSYVLRAGLRFLYFFLLYEHHGWAQWLKASILGALPELSNAIKGAS